MSYKFEDYRIRIGNSNHYPEKFVANIEELHNVIAIIDNKDDAPKILKPLFDEEILRLNKIGNTIPQPGSGKAKITFASFDKIENLRPFIDQFWKKILGTNFSTSFVSNESYFYEWEQYLENGKNDIIKKVKKEYSIDISPIYDKPIYVILETIKNKKTLLEKLIAVFKKNNNR